MRRPYQAAVVVLLFVAGACSLTGCNLIGGAAVVLIPKPPVPAQHDLADKKTLIIVEDRYGVVRDTTVLRQVNASIRDALEEEEVITVGFVPQAELTALQAELGTDYQRTALGTIGQRLGAGQVIYAEVTGYQLELGGGVYQPAMALNVKVIDIDEGERTFPPVRDPETGIELGQATAPVQTSMKAVNRTAEGSAARQLVARELAMQAGLDVARLFFKWRRPEPGDTLRNTQP